MSTRQHVDGVLVEWGARLFYPPNRVMNRYGQGGNRAIQLASISGRRPSAAAVRSKIHATLRQAPQVMVKVTGGGRGMAHIAAHFNYVTRNGQLALENERGEKIEGKAALRELRDDWKLGGTEILERSGRREAFNIVLSMPRTTNAEDVREAAREFAKREFANHAYVMVLHAPGHDKKTDRPHVHLAVRAEGFDGRRLNPRKADLQRWREGFAQALAERGIEALATRRESRGETRRAYPLWEAHSERRKDARGVTGYELERQRNTLRAWREIASALADSGDAQDRLTAVEITRFVTQMPAARLLAANADRVHGVEGRELIERERKWANPER